MSEINVKLNDMIQQRSTMKDVTSFFTTIINAIMAGLSAGYIRLTENSVTCPKCGKNVTEYTLTVTAQFTWIFIFKPTVQIKALYDATDGMAYFRVRLV